MRIRRLHVVVQAMRNFKARPERIVRRQRGIGDRVCRRAGDIRKIVNAGKARRGIRSKQIGGIGDAFAESKRSILVEKIDDSFAVVVVVDAVPARIELFSAPPKSLCQKPCAAPGEKATAIRGATFPFCIGQ